MDVDALVLVSNNDAGTVFIDVWNARASVSRYRRYGATLTWEPALNWEALEDAALEAVEAFGGSASESGHYPCPQHLAELAVFEPRSAR